MTHASRTVRFEAEALARVDCEKSLEPLNSVEALLPVSGERVSNTWVICPKVGNNCSKGQLIPHMIRHSFVRLKDFGPLWEGPAAD